MRRVIPVLAIALAAVGCASAGGGGGGDGDSPFSPDPRVVFIGCVWQRTAAGGPAVPVARVRVQGAEGQSRVYDNLRAGDLIGKVEEGGDFRTGLRVAEIGLADLRMPYRGALLEIPNAHRLVAVDPSGRRLEFWMRPAATSRR